MILESDNYIVICENKFFDTENNNQTSRYFEFFGYEKNGKKCIYVYISLNDVSSVSAECNYDIKYVKFLFKDIVHDVYCSVKPKYNEDILNEYLKSYFYLTYNEYKLDIDRVPYVSSLIDADACYNYYDSNKIFFSSLLI